MNLSTMKDMPGVFTVQGEPGVEFATKNLTPDTTYYGERLLSFNNDQYREWMHSKSKLASGFKRGIRIPELKEGASVLYLGASSGTTVSHVSDIVGKSGTVFAVEFAPRMARDLMRLVSLRDNVLPIVADARYPSEYAHIVDGVDVLYCDVAQPNQSELFVDNAKAFLKSDGVGYIAVKLRSISQKQRSDLIFKEQVSILEKGGFNTLRTADISRIHREHSVYLGKWK